MTKTGDGGGGRWGVILGLAVLGLLLGMSAGCEREPTGGDRALTPAEFIEVIVALREAELEVEREVNPDSVEVEFARRREEIFERYGVGPEGVRAFVERHYHRPGVMSSVWDSIAHRLRTRPSDEPVEGPYPLEESW
jgi:hypothetical protein